MVSRSFDQTEEDDARTLAWQSLPVVQDRMKRINTMARMLQWRFDEHGMTAALRLWMHLDRVGNPVPDIPTAVSRGILK